MRQIWLDLAATMRQLRRAGDLSLRQTAASSSWTRGYLSQVETGYARPSRELVQWYDEHLGGDGILLSLFNEARAATPPPSRRTPSSSDAAIPDHVPDYELVKSDVVQGTLIGPGQSLLLTWTLREPIGVGWRGHLLQRVGAHAGSHVLTGAQFTAIPDSAPDCESTVSVSVTAPQFDTTVIAYWVVTDGERRMLNGPLLPALVVVSSRNPDPGSSLTAT